MGFDPRFILPEEYAQYGLPSSAQQPDIDRLVSLASTRIDEHCGRSDGDGSGSLVYTTYQQRIVCQSLDRQIYYLPHRPLVGITTDTIQALQTADATASGNYFYSGCLPSTTVLADGITLSAIIAASGRQTYERRSRSNYNNFGFQSYLSAQGEISLASGPSQWYGIDLVNLDYDPRSGELWLSENTLFGYRFSEIIVTYNSGYDPRNLPRQIKNVCAQVVLNVISKLGVMGMVSFQAGRASATAQFLPDALTGELKDMLQSFVSIRVN